MADLTYLVATSLDGRVAAPGGDFSAFPVTGDHIEMLVRDYPETMPAPAREAFGLSGAGRHFDTVVMGFETYAAGFPVGLRDPYPHLRQVVATRDRAELLAPGVERLGADPVAAVQELKAESDLGVWLCGGPTLAGVLADEIDRLVLKVNPVLLGDGLPLLSSAYDVRSFELVSCTPYASGVCVSELVRVRG